MRRATAGAATPALLTSSRVRSSGSPPFTAMRAPPPSSRTTRVTVLPQARMAPRLSASASSASM